MRAVFSSAEKAASAAILLALIGAIGKLAGYPWLFASLGPTAALQVTSPQLPMSRAWNVAVGHLIAVAVGYLAVFATGAAHAPAFTSGHVLTFVRVEAAGLSIFLGIALEFALSATHAPAASTALLVALGIMPPTWSAGVSLLCGIALITAGGEVLRLRHGRP